MDHVSISSLESIVSYTLRKDVSEVEFRSVVGAPSQKFKILAIPNVLAEGKSSEHDFAKKCDGHRVYAKSRFDRFFIHRLGNLKYWSFPTY
ncbi:hypothetical protein B296_00053806 [Ensete ventricosum]|uniref:Uncharacterized protein n=1 Tax=Ensete ventricosum TaxID=4639 RepID=A0A426Y2F8_ENSVE|nr:hypothetical protein B296_00053806 [Ensete ventricosum]